MFIDAHAHLSGQQNDELPDILARAAKAGVGAILNVCCDEQDLLRGLELESQVSLPKIYTMAAITPHDSGKEMDNFFKLIEQKAEARKLVAIGEAGLDYYYMHSSSERQKEVLRAHYQLARVCRLPLVIHCRDAFEDLFLVLDDESKQGRVSVMLHCFTGTVNEAIKAVERGYYISISGCVTFPKSSLLREALSVVPLDKIVIETDTPYLAPQGFRGKKNEPAFIVETAKTVAGVKKIDLEELARVTTANTKLLFNL